jgi:hypothetical protein
MKKTYLKPDAEYVSFYTEDAITDELALNEGDILSGGLGAGEVEGEGWT